ncbi:hypothetical protein COF68_04950 [Bacillus toyonensis]|uniref:hypothetical protein n=1 Tax=Bacillus toyonensis TaxID=155322 RepID=UPI000BFB1B95|nr:hypothetical protein [Bacillus toyonensis]PHE64196.1 hypothetical protein COF68_04950 [Bacillus toyonensis]
MNKYQTKVQIFLRSMLQGVTEDLAKSDKEIKKLEEQQDLVGLRIQKDLNKTYVEKKLKLESLIELEDKNFSNKPIVVQVSVVNGDGSMTLTEEYESSIVNELSLAQ